MRILTIFLFSIFLTASSEVTEKELREGLHQFLLEQTGTPDTAFRMHYDPSSILRIELEQSIPWLDADIRNYLSKKIDVPIEITAKNFYQYPSTFLLFLLSMFCLFPFLKISRKKIWSDQTVENKFERLENSNWHKDNGDPNLEINPENGTWYLDALADLTPPHMQHTFESLPFQTALHTLRTMDSEKKKQIINKIDLSRPVKRLITSRQS